jgi:uncharacterized protein
MTKEEIIRQTAKLVKNQMQGEATGHDWWHVYRVWQTALKIGRLEKADLFIIELAALLHDLDDGKFNDSKEPLKALEILNKLEVEENVIAKVIETIKSMSFSLSFKEAGNKPVINTIEGKIIQDADRLDALGAVGIARAFAYGGFKGREIFNPEIKPQIFTSIEHYRTSNSPTLNHFYEKLFLLKDLMNTETAKQIAQERHKYMEEFVNEFMKEWEGK